MPRSEDNLTEVIHLRVTPDTKAWYKEYAKDLGISVPEAERLALAMFRECGGVAYAKEEEKKE